MLRVRIVKVEVTVLNILSDAIHLELGLVDVDFRIAHGDDIDLTFMGLFFEKRAFTHTDANVHLSAAHVVKSRAHLAAFLADKNIKVHIDVASECLVKRVLVQLCLFLLFVLAPTVSPRRLHLFDVVDDVARTRLVILLHSLSNRVVIFTGGCVLTS